MQPLVLALVIELYEFNYISFIKSLKYFLITHTHTHNVTPTHHKHLIYLELGILPGIKPVHSTEPLTGGPPAEQFNVPPHGQKLSPIIGLGSLHYKLEEDVAVISEHCGLGIVQSECLGSCLVLFNGPHSLCHTRLVKAFCEA